MKYAPFALLLAALPVVAHAAPVQPALAVRYKTLAGKKANRFSYSVRYPVFNEAGSSTARLANATLRAYATKEVADFLRHEGQSWREYRAKEPPSGLNYELVINPIVSVAQPGVISVFFTEYSYQGGAHPNTWYPSHSFGLVNGAAKKLTLSDLFTPQTYPYKALSVIAIPELKKRGASSVTGEKPIITALTSEVLTNWTLTPTGITLLFSPYEVASYAEGAYDVKIKYSELTPLLRKNGVLQGFLAAK